MVAVMSESAERLRKQLLDDLTDRFESISRTLSTDPTLTIEDAGALVSAACVEFSRQWEATLTRMPASGSRLRLVLSPSTEEATS
jgi:hypothetical protein